jgi:hemin uptake protein HemP
MSAYKERTNTGDSHYKQLGPPLVVDSRQLLGEGRRVIIKHKGEDYCLSVTRHDKLILTK